MATLIFKATEACNARCIYCDVVHLKKPATITPELLAIVYQRVDEYLKAEPDETLRMTWHGGEPCMAGKEFYRTALELQARYCSRTADRIEYLLQSNLTMMDEEYLSLFRQMGIRSIGTSFESIAGIRGIGPRRDSVEYNRLFMRGIRLLERHGMDWGFIYVVTKAVLHSPLDVFYHLVNLRPDGRFVFHPVVSSRKSAQESRATVMTGKEYADFLGTVFAEWWPRRNRFPHVAPFERYVAAYTGTPYSTTCDFAPDCGRHVYIGPDGSTSQCGRSADWGMLDYGNIADTSLQQIFEHPLRRPLYERANVLAAGECHDCAYRHLCNGGCPLDAFNTYGDFYRKTGLCDTTRLFLHKYFEPISGLRLPDGNL